MSGVPYTFASATSSIPLSELDTNFATPVTIGTTSVTLGNTVTTLANVALANVTISSVASGIPNNFLANSSVTIGNTSVALGNTVTSLGNVTLTNVTIQGGTSNVSTNSIVNGTSNVAIASANGAITMVTNGNTAVTIDTSQNVGVGVTPSAWGTSGTTAKAIQFPTYGSIANFSDSSMHMVENAYWTGSGWTYLNGTAASATKYTQSIGAHYWYYAGAGTGAVSFTQAMTLDTSGNLLVGVASATGVGGTTIAPKYTLWNTADTSLTVAYFQYNSSTVGSISRTTTTTSYNTSSDRRLKTNIADLTNSGTVIDSLKPRTFTWVADNSNDVGFIADEIQEVLPKAVTGQPNATKEEEYEVTPAVKDLMGNITTPAVMGTRTVPVYQMIDASQPELIAYLVAEVQSLRARLKAANIA